MKKNIFVFMLSLFVAGMVGCSNDNDEVDNIITPVEDTSNSEEEEEDSLSYILSPVTDVDKNISSRLSRFYIFGKNNPGGDYKKFKNECFIVNSLDELKEILGYYYREIPELDFSKYSLVVGQCIERKNFWKETSQRIRKEGKSLFLDLYYTDYYGISGYVATCEINISFWGLYPKIKKRDITAVVHVSKATTL